MKEINIYIQGVPEWSVQTLWISSRDLNKQKMSHKHGVGNACFWSYDGSKFSCNSWRNYHVKSHRCYKTVFKNMNESNYLFDELADIYLMYGRAGGNGQFARQCGDMRPCPRNLFTKFVQTIQGHPVYTRNFKL